MQCATITHRPTDPPAWPQFGFRGRMSCRLSWLESLLAWKRDFQVERPGASCSGAKWSLCKTKPPAPIHSNGITQQTGFKEGRASALIAPSPLCLC